MDIESQNLSTDQCLNSKWIGDDNVREASSHCKLHRNMNGTYQEQLSE